MNACKIQGRGKVSEEMSFKSHTMVRTGEDRSKGAMRNSQTVRAETIQRVHTNAAVASERENVKIKLMSDITFK